MVRFTNSAWRGTKFLLQISQDNFFWKLGIYNNNFFDVVWVFVFLVRLIPSPEPTAIRCQSIADIAVSIGNTESVNSREKAKPVSFFHENQPTAMSLPTCFIFTPNETCKCLSAEGNFIVLQCSNRQLCWNCKALQQWNNISHIGLYSWLLLQGLRSMWEKILDGFWCLVINKLSLYDNFVINVCVPCSFLALIKQYRENRPKKFYCLSSTKKLQGTYTFISICSSNTWYSCMLSYI